jgi:hypothetical protein
MPDGVKHPEAGSIYAAAEAEGARSGEPRCWMRTLALLILANSIDKVVPITCVSSEALAALSITGDASISTLPASSRQLGAVLASYPASFLMGRVGRRVGFVTGALIGMCGGLTAALGLQLGSFPLLCLGRCRADAHRCPSVDLRGEALIRPCPPLRRRQRPRRRRDWLRRCAPRLALLRAAVLNAALNTAQRCIDDCCASLSLERAWRRLRQVRGGGGRAGGAQDPRHLVDHLQLGLRSGSPFPSDVVQLWWPKYRVI